MSALTYRPAQRGAVAPRLVGPGVRSLRCPAACAVRATPRAMPPRPRRGRRPAAPVATDAPPVRDHVPTSSAVDGRLGERARREPAEQAHRRGRRLDRRRPTGGDYPRTDFSDAFADLHRGARRPGARRRRPDVSNAAVGGRARRGRALVRRRADSTSSPWPAGPSAVTARVDLLLDLSGAVTGAERVRAVAGHLYLHPRGTAAAGERLRLRRLDAGGRSDAARRPWCASRRRMRPLAGAPCSPSCWRSPALVVPDSSRRLDPGGAGQGPPRPGRGARTPTSSGSSRSAPTPGPGRT